MENEFIEQSIYRMRENTSKVIKCLEILTEDEIWGKPSETLNSVGNLVLHLCGNITQYIISTLGDAPDDRDREKEFSAKRGLSKVELTQKLNSTVDRATEIISRQTKQSLVAVKNVQAYSLSGIGIILHVVEHYSYHTGQIIFWTKMKRDTDMGFYAGVDLNKKHK